MEDAGVIQLETEDKLPKSLVPHVSLIGYLQDSHDAASKRADFMNSFLSMIKRASEAHDLKPYGDKA